MARPAAEIVHESVESGKLTAVSESQESKESSGTPEVAGGDASSLALARSQARLAEMAGQHGTAPQEGREVVFRLDSVSVSYSGNVAIRDVNFEIHQHLVTAFIGPSGCGKTTLIRSINRMNDLIPGAAVEGTISYHGNDLFRPGWTPSRCAGGSAWSSSDPTRSRSRSTTTSPSGFACTA